MALGPKMVMRQSQSLVMTPQLLQAIKLLQLSATELSAYVDAELERNPLLERADSPDDGPVDPSLVDPGLGVNGTAERAPAEGDWAAETMAADRAGLESEFGADFSNAFPDDAPAPPAAMEPAGESLHWNLSSGSGKGGTTLDDEDPNLEAFVAASETLQDHLLRQLGCLDVPARQKAIAEILINSLEPTGYLAEPVAEIAARLSIPEAEVQQALALVQGFDPAGVGARTLAECLALQLKDKNRFDPAMEALLANLDLLARKDGATLRRRCGVDEDDLADMIKEIRRLDPKPGLIFGAAPIEPIIPDVRVRPAADGGWTVEINPDAMPRVVANRSFYATVSGGAGDKTAKHFIEEAWSSANWMVRSLEQRAKTVLKVATEIVRQQDGFFAHGIAYLRPLNLKAVADVLGLHESTISRVTANKFMATPRGLFEMKYFFTTAINVSGGEAVSAEAVRFKIRQLIEGENASTILSDDAIVAKLKAQGIEIARRTVAKYREGMGIASSATRRRELLAARPQSRAS